MTDPLPDDVAVADIGPQLGELDGKLAAALQRVGHSLRTLMWDQARAHRLSPMQVEILLRLGREPPERRRVGTLAAELDVKAPTVSDAAAALERKGLLEGVAIEGDRRGRLLQLSPAGGELVAALAGWQRPVAEHLGTVDPREKAQALALLLDLMASLRREGVIGVARVCPTCRFFRRDAHPGDPAVHHCALLDSPMTLADLRVDCAEHEQARTPA